MARLIGRSMLLTRVTGPDWGSLLEPASGTSPFAHAEPPRQYNDDSLGAVPSFDKRPQEVLKFRGREGNLNVG